MIVEVVVTFAGLCIPMLGFLTYFFQGVVEEMAVELLTRPTVEEQAEQQKEIEELREELRIVKAALKEESQRSDWLWMICTGLITLIVTGGLVSLTTATRD